MIRRIRVRLAHWLDPDKTGERAGERFTRLNRSDDHKKFLVWLPMKVLCPTWWNFDQAKMFATARLWGRCGDDDYCAEMFGGEGDEATAVMVTENEMPGPPPSCYAKR